MAKKEQEPQAPKIKDERFNEGTRFRLYGQYNEYLYSLTPFYEPTDTFREHGSHFDTYAQVTRDTYEDCYRVSLFVEVCGGDKEIYIALPKDDLLALATEGKRIETQENILTHALADKCKEDGLTPVIEPMALQQLNKKGLLEVGNNLMIDGRNYGTIVDSIENNGVITVTTNSFMVSTFDFKNTYNQTMLGIYDYAKQRDNVQPLLPDEVKSFANNNHDILPLTPRQNDVGFAGQFYLKQALSNDEFVKNFGIIAANYMHDHNITDIANDPAQILEVGKLLELQLRDYGYIKPDPKEITQMDLQYMSSLGYDQNSMDLKKETLERWSKEKELTPAQQQAINAILSDKKIILCEIEPDSCKVKKDMIFFNLHEKTDNPRRMFINGGKFTGTMRDGSTDDIERGELTMPAGRVDVEYDAPDDKFAAYADNMIITNDPEILNAYLDLGGYNEGRIMDRAHDEGIIMTMDEFEQMSFDLDQDPGIEMRN